MDESTTNSSPELGVDLFEWRNALLEVSMFLGSPSTREMPKTIGTRGTDDLVFPEWLRRIIRHVSNRQVLRGNLPDFIDCIKDTPIVFPHPFHYPPAIVPNVYKFKDFEGSSHRILIELIRRFAPRGVTLLDLGAAGLVANGDEVFI